MSLNENKIEIEHKQDKLPIVPEEISNSNTSRNDDNKKLAKANHQKIESSTSIIHKLDDIILMSPKHNHFPYCIVWTPIPFVSNVIPLIGHLSVGNAEGLLHDFCGSRYVGVDINSFGRPIMYYQLDISSKDSVEWNNCIKHADQMFRRKEYNICGTNCLSYCGFILSNFNYKGNRYYSNKDVWKLIWKNGVYISSFNRVKNYLFIGIIFIILTVIIIIFSTK